MSTLMIGNPTTEVVIRYVQCYAQAVFLSYSLKKATRLTGMDGCDALCLDGSLMNMSYQYYPVIQHFLTNFLT